MHYATTNTSAISKTKRKAGYLLTAILLGGLSVTSAQADDSKLYPGSYCKARGSYSIDDMTSGTGAISNTSFSSSVTVNCPIIRDSMASDTGIRRVRIWFRNNNTEKKINCRVETHHRTGALVKRVVGSTALGARQGSLLIQYGGDAGVDRHYILACTLPPTVENFRFPSIDAFQVDEFN